MSAPNLEAVVKKLALRLDRRKLTDYEGKYVVFNGEQLLSSDSYDGAMKLGIRKFGKDNGFVVRLVGSQPTLSHLVRG